MHLRQVHPLNNCTNKSRTAPTKKCINQPLLVHLRQVHPLNNCTNQELRHSSKNTKKGCSCINCTPNYLY